MYKYIPSLLCICGFNTFSYLYIPYVEIQLVCVRLVAQLCPTLWDPMDCTAHQTPLSMGFSRQEY